MRLYEQGIMDATGETDPVRIEKIEGLMRDYSYNRCLDHLDSGSFTDIAIIAKERLDG